MVDELYQWRAHRDHVESYLMDEYNDGITDPEPAPVRLVDLAASPDLEHPVTCGMLRELGEIASEFAAGGLAPGTVRVCAAWPPTARPATTQVIQVTAGWWSLAARHPGGPCVALMDGSGLYDLTAAADIGGLLDTVAAVAVEEPLPWPCGICGHPRRAREFGEHGYVGGPGEDPWVCDHCEALTAGGQ